MAEYDIIIIGGGMVGASLASALHNTTLRIALIDAAPYPIAHDPRLIALTYGSCCLLQNLSIWPQLAPHATAIKQIHVSHRGRFGSARIHAQELNLPNLGHLVPAQFINAALDEQLKNTAIKIYRPATLKNLSLEHSTVTIEMESAIKTLSARIIIGADGTHSTVRECLNIPTKTFDYEQSAIVTITELQRDHQHIAYERFLAEGAIAMLPLTDRCSATIWTDNNKIISRLLAMNDVEFLAELQKTFGYRLGRLLAIRKRYTYPLKLTLAEEVQRQNVILIGNAAHTFHPIAAQGLNIALYEVAELAAALQTGEMPNAANLFKKGITNVSHSLTQLFSADFFMVNFARQLGMLGLDMLPSAKKLFMRKAMGRMGKIPHLLQEKDNYEITNNNRY